MGLRYKTGCDGKGRVILTGLQSGLGRGTYTGRGGMELIGRKASSHKGDTRHSLSFFKGVGKWKMVRGE